MILSILCYLLPSVELLGLTNPRFLNPGPTTIQFSNHIDAVVPYYNIDHLHYFTCKVIDESYYSALLFRNVFNSGKQKMFAAFSCL